MNTDDFYAGFCFGLAATEYIHDIPRDADATWDKLKACMRGIVSQEITLVDSPEESERQLPPLSREAKAASGFDASAYLRELLRKGREQQEV